MECQEKNEIKLQKSIDNPIKMDYNKAVLELQ